MDFASPFLQGSFIPDCTPVYPGACACRRARLRNGAAREPSRDREGTVYRSTENALTRQLRHPRIQRLQLPQIVFRLLNRRLDARQVARLQARPPASPASARSK